MVSKEGFHIREGTSHTMSWASKSGKDGTAALAEGAVRCATGAVLVPISSHVAGAAGAKQGVTGAAGDRVNLVPRGG